MTPIVPHIAHFQSIPWCAKLLANPTFSVILTPTRVPKSNNEDSLFAETLNTSRTIPAILSLIRNPAPTNPRLIVETRLLVTLGDGLDGYPRICHGGIVGTLIDEGMGMLLSANKDLEGGELRMDTMTAYLNIKYLKPVATPGTVVVSARLQTVQGRKYFLDAFVSDGSSTILASAEALFVGLVGKL